MPDSPSPILQLAYELRDRRRAEADRLRGARAETLATPPPPWAAAIAQTVPPRPVGSALATVAALGLGLLAVAAVVFTVALITHGADVLREGSTPPFMGRPVLSAYVLAAGPVAAITTFTTFTAARRSK